MQYDNLDMKFNYFRSFNYTIAVPRPSTDMSLWLLSGLLQDQMSWEITVNSIWLYIWLLPQCAMIFYLIE